MALASFEVALLKVPSAWHAAARTPASVSFFAAAATTSTLSVAVERVEDLDGAAPHVGAGVASSARRCSRPPRRS